MLDSGERNDLSVKCYSYLTVESIAVASRWCEAVLYSPDPPLVFGGGSG